jgi:hypothetical protein
MPKRKDANHPAIQKTLERAGAFCIDMTPNPGAGFDQLVFYRGKIFVVEIKSPGGKLTRHERDVMECLEYQHVEYHILTTVDQAIRMLENSQG